VLKGRYEQIRFLLLTGVSRFSRVSIFSDLNNLEDITIGQNFNNLVGITQYELEQSFAPELESMAADGVGLATDIKAWYNGYTWGGHDTLYNPFSLLNLMKSREFRNFWYTTGTPTFLLSQLKRLKLGDMDGLRVSENALADFDANDPGDVPNVIAALDSLIGQVPYDHWRADKESIFTVITVLTFKLAGVEVHTEVHSSRGRCDVLVKTPTFIYVMELKLDATAQEALDQILTQSYLQPYRNDRRKKLAIGIAFSSESRTVAEYLVEEM